MKNLCKLLNKTNRKKQMKLNALDYMGISGHFSEEELMVQNTARDFSEKEIMPIIEEYYEKGEFPEHLIPKFGELGFFP